MSSRLLSSGPAALTSALVRLFLKSLEGGPVGSLFDRVVERKVAAALAPLQEKVKKLEGGE